MIRSFRKLKIQFAESPYCEHCGKLEPFDAVRLDGGTNWCLSCVDLDEEQFNEEELIAIGKKECLLKIKYYEKKIIELRIKLYGYDEDNE